MLKLGQDALNVDVSCLEQILGNLEIQRAATSLQQTAEWGMHGFQSYFPRTKVRFIYEERGERRITLKKFVLLYTLCARFVGFNQIQSVAFLRHDVNQEFLNEYLN